jgi:trehalose 6-phosphate phosphatase
VPLRDRAREAALFLDFDGTLAPIVPDPASAAPAPGVPALLGRLAAGLGRVAVVSGRPASYLVGVLGPPPGVRLVGLYGMEEVEADGTVREDPEAARWRPVVEEVTRALAAAAPAGADVEAKGLTVTLHWRRAPSTEAWARAGAGAEAARTGLLVQPGRMAVELRPPAHADKGTVVERLAGRFPVVAYVGDDVGDVPAFAALGAMAAEGRTVVRVAVADAESPPALAEAADLVVGSTGEAVALLEALAASVRPPGA